MPPGEAELTYKLPSIIQSIQDNWQLTCQSAAIISALLAVVSTILLGILKGADNTLPQGVTQGNLHLALLTLSYSSLILNITACLSSFTLIDKLGELPFRASQRRGSKSLPIAGYIQGTSEQLLLRYGVGGLWKVVVWHWALSYLLGILTILAQIALYVWIQEPSTIRIVVACLCGFSIIPLVLIALAPCFSRKDNTETGSDPSTRMRHSHYSDSLPRPSNVSAFGYVPNTM